METSSSDKGWSKKRDSSRRAFTCFCLYSSTGGQFIVLGGWRVHKACACTGTWRFLTRIQTCSSVCRLMMLYRKSALERAMWLKKRYVWTEVSMNGQEEVEAGEVQLTYLRYGNVVTVHLQHEHIPPLASSITAWNIWEPFIYLSEGSTKRAVVIFNFRW